MDKKRQITFENFKKYVEERGGTCLSNEYINKNTKMKVQCEKGHIWEANFGTIYYQKYWCPYCEKEFRFQKVKKYIEEKGGKCLSNEYINNYTKVRVQCEKGHIWEVKPNSLINKKNWCRMCGFDKQRKNIKDVIEFIENKGGKLLSEKYIGCDQKLKVQCSKGHIWKPTYTKLKGGTWCLICYYYEKRMNYFRSILKIAENKGGKCLSEFSDYNDGKSKLKFQCSKKHKWETSATCVKNGCWCPICGVEGSKKEENMNKLRKVVKKKGGKLFTEEYKSIKQRVKIECSEGHIWEPMLFNVIKGTWCPICAHLDCELTNEEKFKSFNNICEISKNKGGKCLSELSNYKNYASKLLFKCNRGHIWKTDASCIVGDHWCPICNQSFSEKYFRFVIEKLFNYSFKTIYPKWLRNKKGYRLQIDGYNKELKLGFEYQGRQHFIYVEFFHRTKENFEYIKSNDCIKKKILKNRNIFMLYPTYLLKKENYKSYVLSKIKNTKFEDFVDKNIEISLTEFYKKVN